MGRHSAPTVVVEAATSQRRAVPEARHRSASSGRRIAHWPVALVAVLALGLAGWLGWSWANSEVDSRASAQATSCTDGDSTLRVAAPREVAGQVRDAANRWNSQRKVVEGHCVRVDVATSDPQAVYSGLTGRWDSGKLGPRPEAWIASSTSQAERLTQRFPDLVGSKPEPVNGNRSFVALSGDDVSDVQIRAAQMFRTLLQRTT